MKKTPRFCTTILVGKNASMDGSTIIARNEDGSDSANPQKFVLITPEQQPTTYISKVNQVKVPLPELSLSYTSTPDADDSYGTFAGAGINSLNVSMTATETSTTNSRILGIDPFVESGIGEADFVTLVLPYIKSAREGVLRLGDLLETYGTYESNGIAFSDKDEIWYLETIGGHHWAAMKIPDDAYVIAPNQFNIDEFYFDTEDNLYSEDLLTMINDNHLNPDFDGFNLRHIFGSRTIKDTEYNTPRAWFIQKYFNPELTQKIENFDLPFTLKPSRKISIEDIKWCLSSHYENTDFDPYIENGVPKKYRSIGLNRNLEVHLLQIRPNVPEEIAGIHWLAFGPNSFNALVPFYTRITDTPQTFKETSSHYQPQSIYWLNRTIALLGDTNYTLYSSLHEAFELEMMAHCRFIQKQTDQQFISKELGLDDLEKVNNQLAEHYLEKATELLGEMVNQGTKKMTLRFNLSD
ncbi:C69 family dipeptidase [Vagococcus hydrophili]|uniref:Dipeptidase n=1 Tax=Vagococcus hydrophili TaxID=2714947 RepID=A0A6G8AUD1_9ENTE|nr:C69 family dipeptidase [Vagococcus hydrophili]QIL48691.1 C69 family dipeptidase [Vagococcus hydrophili]